jgi:hypothetical protein
MFSNELFVKVSGCIYLPVVINQKVAICVHVCVRLKSGFYDLHAGFRYLPASQECVLYEWGGTAIYLKEIAINSKLLLL